METINKNNLNEAKNNTFDDEGSSFDVMKWVRLILRYWYLFVLSISVALTWAYLENKKWVPTYKVSSKVIIDDNSRSLNGASVVMQGFNVQSGYKNVNNQIIMFGSSDLTERAVERLGLDVDYYMRGRFKTSNLYKRNPVEITHDYLSDLVYSMEFSFKGLNDSVFQISYPETKQMKSFSYKGKYGVPIKNSMFFVTVNKTDYYYPKAEFYFKFRSKQSWVSEFNSRLSFSFVMDKSSVIDVSLVGKVADRDKNFADALCEEFLADNLQRKNDAAIKTIDFIDAQLLGIADSLNTAEANLRSFRAENKMFDISAYSANLATQMNSFDQKKNELNLKKTYLDYLSDYLKGNIEDGKIVAPSSLGVMDPLLMQQVRELTDLQIKRDEMGEKSPYYKKYQSQIDIKKETLFEVLNNMYADYKIELDNFHNQFNEVVNKIGLLTDKESQMINYQRAYKIHDNYYTFLMQKRAEAQIQKASNSPDNIILDKARISGVMNAGVKSKKYSQYLLIGLLLPLVFVILKELLNSTIRDRNDIKKYTRFDIIGTIQKGKSSSEPLLVKKYPKSIFAESFRLVRTRLEFIAKSKKNTSASILVTSTESGDGKSFFSINLAGIYAMEKKKTLLIDLDLRKPSINKMLSIERNKGISNYLIGQVELEDILIQDTDYDFDIILAGTIPPNPGELVKTEKLKELFEILKERYEYIVIDSSPIGLVGDAYALTHLVDANLFIVRQEKTNKTFFKNVIEQMREDRIPNVYLILNGVDMKQHQYSTYHGGYHSYLRKFYTSDYTKNYYYEYYDN